MVMMCSTLSPSRREAETRHGLQISVAREWYDILVTIDCDKYPNTSGNVHNFLHCMSGVQRFSFSTRRYLERTLRSFFYAQVS